MIRSGLFFLFAVLIMVLGACSFTDSKVAEFKEEMRSEQGGEESRGLNKDQGRDGLSESDDVSRDEKGAESSNLSDEKVKVIMGKTIDNIVRTIGKVSDSRNDWITEAREQIIHDEATKLVKPLSKFLDEDIAYETAADFLDWMNCECDGGLPFTSFDLNAGFKIIELTDKKIKAESIDLGDGMLYDIGVKHGWYFFKDDGDWKLSKHEYIPTDDFDLTFEDLEHAFLKYDEKQNRYTDEIIPIEFVEYFEDAGERYLSIRFPRNHSPYYGEHAIYNTKRASLDMQMTELYNP